MDGALSSSRDRSERGGGYYGPSSGGGDRDRSSYGGGGGGGYRHGGRGRGGGGRGRRHHSHSPYNRHGRGGGGGRGRRSPGGGRGGRSSPGNRFSASRTTSVDPKIAMLRQLSAMVAKMGDLVGAADSGSAPPPSGDGDGDGGSSAAPRPVVRAVAKNASDLIGVLCSESNAPLFLRYENEDGTEGGATEAQAAAAAAAAKTEENGGGGGGAIDGDAQQQAKPAPPATVKADDISGPLAALLTSCAVTLPTQTPSHAALTLGVDVSSPPAYGGFASRCIHLLTRRFGSDLDAALGLRTADGGDESMSTSPSSSSDDTTSSGENLSGNGWDGASTIPVDAYVRAKLALRYLALMGRVGVLAGYDAATDATTTAFAGSATEGHTVAGLLVLLLEAADRAADAAAHPPPTSAALSDGEVRAQSKSYRHASLILLSLVLSTVPYVVSYLPRDCVEGTLLSRVDSLLATYESTYRPGVGVTALLLDGPQVEDKVAGAAIDEDDDEDEDDEDEEDEDDDGSGVCCDTLQDLARTVKAVVTAHYDSDDGATTRGTLAGTCFALPADAPWSDLTVEASPASTDGDAMEDCGGGAQKGAVYTGEPLRIMSLTAGSQSQTISRAARYLLALGESSDNEGQMFLRISNLDGIVYGRLAVFGLGDDDDDDEDDEDNQAQSNPEQDAYTKGFGLLDRCLLSEAVRDALVCHRPTVTATGAERGSCRDVAEQVMAVGHLFVPQYQSPAKENGGGDSSMATSSGDAGPKSARGIEYGIVETILSLIVQANKRREGSDVSGSPLGHLYLSRVLLEMTKLQPTLMPRAIVAAISALFEDFLPSLVPSARAALADWLALHLTNTSYQWPSLYWTHWTPYAQAFVESGQRNSRGEFVMEALRDMIELQGSPDTLVSECLPTGSPLVNLLLPKEDSTAGSGDTLHALTKDLEERIWVHNDDPDAVREYIVGDEVQESISGSIGDSTESQIWWRTSVVVKAILQPGKKDLDRAQKAVQKACDKLAGGDDGDFMEEEDLDEATEDVVVDATEAIGRYKPVVLAAMARDLQVYEEGQASSDLNESDMLLMGEIRVLRQTEALASYSQSVLEAYVGSLVHNRVVTPLAIVQWALGESDVPAAGVTATPSVHASWYQYALQAVRMAASMELSDNGVAGGMIIDRSGEVENNDMDSDESAATQRANKIISAVAPLLKYAAVRVCNILAGTDEHDRKKVKPIEADLIDGLKMLVTLVPSQIRSILANDKTLFEGATESKSSTVAKDIESCLAKSSISDLSTACRQECTSLTRFVEVVLNFMEA